VSRIYTGKITLEIGRDFQLTKKLGEGQRGAVFLAENIKDNKDKICIKIETSQKRAEQEVSAINTFYGMNSEVQEINGNFYFFMPFFSGKNLKELVKDGLTLQQRISITIGLKQQLEKLHAKNILHRDLKYDNIMVDLNSSPIKVNIIDLGRSVYLDSAEQLQLKTNKILLRFQSQVAPEYIKNDGIIGKHSDIYSFGKIFKKLFPENKWIIDTLLVCNPTERYQHFNEINNKLTISGSRRSRNPL
jgi:serine/threonine protein kinase